MINLKLIVQLKTYYPNATPKRRTPLTPLVTIAKLELFPHANIEGNCDGDKIGRSQSESTKIGCGPLELTRSVSIRWRGVWWFGFVWSERLSI